ncbi:MAG TPA: hypothetical protein VE992_05550, partial [Solirubrobacteraceae bacterium]|nr:hypothetical protein [Solirubrobacteraceae bacterium]
MGLGVRRLERRAGQAGGAQHGPGAGGEVAVDRALAGEVVEQRDRELAAGQRAGLVRAHHLDAAERLHGGEPAHERVAGGQPPRHRRLGHAGQQRQPLGDRRDGNAGADGQLCHRRAAPRDAGQGHERAAAEDHRHGLAEQAIEALAQRALAVLIDGQRGGRRPQAGAPPHRHDDGLARPHGDVRALEHDPVLGPRRRGCLAHRKRLARERGLVDLEGVGLDQARVGHEPVTGPQEHHVTHHDLLGPQLAHLAVAQHARPGRAQLLERLRGAPRLALLPGRHSGPGHDHRPDDDHVGERTHGQRQPRAHPQHADQRGLELLGDGRREAVARARTALMRPALLGLGGPQATGAGVELSHDLRDAHPCPALRARIAQAVDDGARAPAAAQSLPRDADGAERAGVGRVGGA